MSNIQARSFTPQDLRNIRTAMLGDTRLFKSAEPEKAPVSDGKQDVFVLAPENGLFKSAEVVDLAKSLGDQGVEVQDSTHGVLSARVSAQDKSKLEELGYQVFDNSPRSLLPNLPRARSGNASWELPTVKPVQMTKADRLHQAGVTGKGQVVAILDSGFDHPAANGKLAGWLDIVERSSKPHDGSGHGTHVAGDVLQTAPDAKLIAIKVMADDGTGRPGDIIRGLRAVEMLKQKGMDVDVVNMSLGGEADGEPDVDDPINREVEKLSQMGVTVIAAAGNSGPNPHTIGAPADAPSAIAVGAALDPTHVSDFSSRGPTDDGRIRPDVLAPGEFIVSWGVPDSEIYQQAEAFTLLRSMPAHQLKEFVAERPQLLEALGMPADLLERSDAEFEQVFKGGLPPLYVTPEGNVAGPGTSFAAPLTSGIAASLEQVKDLRPEEMRQLLTASADRMGSQPAVEQGAGFINAEKALQQLQG